MRFMSKFMKVFNIMNNQIADIKSFLIKEWTNIKKNSWKKGKIRQNELNVLSNKIFSRCISGICKNEYKIKKDGYGTTFQVDAAYFNDKQEVISVVLNKSLLLSINKNQRNIANCTVAEGIGRISNAKISTLKNCIFFTLIPNKTFVLKGNGDIERVENTNIIDISDVFNILDRNKVNVNIQTITVKYNLPERMFVDKSLDFYTTDDIAITNEEDIIKKIGEIK